MCLLSLLDSRVSSRRGFTLIELLVVISIIAVLVGIAFPVLQNMGTRGKMIKEVQAGRALITGYLAAAADRDGQLLPGYDRTVTQVVLPDGTSQGTPIANRYPFRLLPYLNNRIDGTILVNDNAKSIAASNVYEISCYPAFGMNYLFVGGDISSSGVMSYPAECVFRQGTAESSPLVFVSAAGDGATPTNKVRGYCLLTPPQTTGTMWTSTKWKNTSAASEYGNVDPRFNGKAVCVFLDGSIQQLGIEDLRDMRLWSRNAALQNNPKYTIASTPSTGGR